VEVHVTQARTAAEQLWHRTPSSCAARETFFDGNNDGIGDFPGLISKLDYIADLGVNAGGCCRLPLAAVDDGYDNSGYRNVHPEYGALDDSVVRPRGSMPAMFVITDLEINHTRPTPFGFSEPGGQSQDRHGATSMFGPTMTKSTPARASSR
jgi:hypothetical protein